MNSRLWIESEDKGEGCFFDLFESFIRYGNMSSVDLGKLSVEEYGNSFLVKSIDRELRSSTLPADRE